MLSIAKHLLTIKYIVIITNRVRIGVEERVDDRLKKDSLQALSSVCQHSVIV